MSSPARRWRMEATRSYSGLPRRLVRAGPAFEGAAARGSASGRSGSSEREVGRMAVKKIAHPSVNDRKAEGLEARDGAPLSSHSKWSPAAERPDPVALLDKQDKTREPDLVPVRHGRMMV